MAESVRVHPEVLKEILMYARRDPQTECCGLLAGRKGLIVAVFPARNILASATAYEIASQELFDIFRALRSERLTHLGQYHSHPSTENVPSPTDIEQAGYPEQAYFIVSPRADAPKPVRAFSIRDGAVSELEIIAATS